MRQFNDTTGFSWSISITVETVKRVKDITKIDILTILSSPGALEEVMGDIVRFAEVLYATVKPQADQAGITPDQFASRFDGSVLDVASKQFFEELVDFFPPKKRQILRNLLMKVYQMEEIQLTKVNQAITDLDIGELSGNSQELSESTQVRSP
jgi:hypothetical protein